MLKWKTGIAGVGVQQSDRKFGFALPDWVAPRRPDAVNLQGRYVRLERLDADRHAVDLHAANCTDERIWDYLPYGPFVREVDYCGWVKAMQGQEDPYFYAIIDHESGRAGGVASYLRVAPQAGSIEVGHINLAPNMQASRAATEAMFLMADWAFGAGYRRYEWKCDALNLASRRAAGRLGFSYEGIFRQAAVYKGRNRDTAWFAMIDGDWPKIRAAYQAWLDPGNFDALGQQRRALSALTRPLLFARDPLTATP